VHFGYDINVQIFNIYIFYIITIYFRFLVINNDIKLIFSLIVENILLKRLKIRSKCYPVRAIAPNVNLKGR